ncbi:hypothetical protein MRY87_08505 [bacterium]|nr:hypothetical protein [bacterium]
MRRVLLATTAMLLLFPLFHIPSTHLVAEEPQAEEAPIVRSKMKKAYKPFLELQTFFVEHEEITSSEEQEELERIVDSLEKKFHGVIDAPKSKYRDIPGFTSTLQSLNSLFRDIKGGLKWGNESWAYWRLRALASHCITCHTSYAPKMQFYDPEYSAENLTPFRRGEFFLATRQFSRAEKAFLESAGSPESSADVLTSLRRWLLLSVRIQRTPKEAGKTLDAFYRQHEKNLNQYEKEVILGWKESLRAWEGEHEEDSLAEAERLLNVGLRSSDLLYDEQDDIRVLRATALLHRLSESKTQTEQDRRRTLYLLGLSYSKLPHFFINELPDIYLEQCIREYPNTKEAKRSYRLLKEMTTLGFTGSGGTRIPDYINLKLRELHNLAYGIPDFDARV